MVALECGGTLPGRPFPEAVVVVETIPVVADGGIGVVIIRYQIDTDGDGVSDEKEDDAGTIKMTHYRFQQPRQ